MESVSVCGGETDGETGGETGGGTGGRLGVGRPCMELEEPITLSLDSNSVQNLNSDHNLDHEKLENINNREQSAEYTSTTRNTPIEKVAHVPLKKVASVTEVQQRPQKFRHRKIRGYHKGSSMKPHNVHPEYNRSQKAQHHKQHHHQHRHHNAPSKHQDKHHHDQNKHKHVLGQPIHNESRYGHHNKSHHRRTGRDARQYLGGSSKLQLAFYPEDFIPEYMKRRFESHISRLDSKLNGTYIIHVNQEAAYDNQQLPTADKTQYGNGIEYNIETVSNSSLTSINVKGRNRFSVLAGLFEVLKSFGLQRLHPLDVHYIPKEHIEPINETFVSKYKVIGTHLHTMHPLELTDLLNGFVNHSLTIGTMETFISVVDQHWNTYLEWMVASKTNMLEWVLLRVHSKYDKSSERISRLKLLVERAHNFGIFVGIDVPIALQQQHSWSLIQSFGDIKKEYHQISESVSILSSADFDFISTEIGFSEFTHGNVTRMLNWLDELTRVATSMNMRTYTKCHISTGQVEKGWIDPVTKEDGMNFNFLPYYASKDLGVYPHTVQYYSFDDPANTYGNANFTNMLKYLEIELGRREVIYFPENAYWVNYDINVPLFLPLYIDRRLYDLRLIAQVEERVGKKMDGHITFSSGWEFGYWLNDKIVNEMAASFDTIDLKRSHDEDLHRLLMRHFKQFGDDATVNELTNIMMELIARQREYLIYGSIDGKRPSTTLRRSGQSYLEGWDTWSDIMGYITQYFGKNIATQPDGLRVLQVRNGLDQVLPGPKYAEISPLLKEMSIAFQNSASKFYALAPRINPEVRDLFDDITESTHITALRAAQVYETFEYAYSVRQRASEDELKQRKIKLFEIMKEATEVMKHRVAYFHAENIGTWNDNPTAYKFYYVFHARTLYFWWRDIGQALFNELSPCYMNVINPVDVGVGEGFLSELAQAIREFLDMMKKAEWIADCLGAPSKEPQIPPFNTD